MNQWLRREYKFSGRVKIGKKWYPAIIMLQPDLRTNIFMPIINYSNEEIPTLIEGQIEEWKLKISGAIFVSYRPEHFDSIYKRVKLTESEKNVFQNEDYEKLWVEIGLLPETCTFTKTENADFIPDEWGIFFYPEKNDNALAHFFNGVLGARELPNIFSAGDNCAYFTNTVRWTSNTIRKRTKLLTSCLSLFAGAPVSYELLIGRHKNKIGFIQFNNEPNPHAYICPSQYNGHADMENISPHFFIELTQKVEELFIKSKYEKTQILLSYFKTLYTALYDEAKIAFSFQLMESLAGYKNMSLKNPLKNKIKEEILKKYSKKLCKSCYHIIENEVNPVDDAFDGYIGKALDTIKIEKPFKIPPTLIREIAKRYRNKVFHGNFFEDMTEIDKTIATLPKSYQEDLPLVFQAIVSIIGANFILGIDFDQMGAVKRKMH